MHLLDCVNGTICLSLLFLVVSLKWEIRTYTIFAIVCKTVEKKPKMVYTIFNSASVSDFLP